MDFFFILVSLLISQCAAFVRGPITNVRAFESNHLRNQILVGSQFMDFLKSRGGQFLKIDSSRDSKPFGIVSIFLKGVNIPLSEIKDVIQESAPLAWERGIPVFRIRPDCPVDYLLEDALNAISKGSGPSSSPIFLCDDYIVDNSVEVPIILFSGLENDVVRAVSRSLVQRIYATTGQRAAVAKVVPPAMKKSLRQLFDEISGDHIEAIAMARQRLSATNTSV